jgi:hypothetical protein
MSKFHVISHEEVVSAEHRLTAQRLLAESVIDSIFQAKRIILVTGAGISVSAGIPVSFPLNLKIMN